MKKRAAADEDAAGDAALPEAIAGMPAVSVLRHQKRGLLLRLAEQKRSLEAAAAQNAALQKRETCAETCCSALRQTWALLDAHLAAFVARLGGAQSLFDKEPLGHMAKFIRSFSPDVGDNMHSELAAELEARSAATRVLLERLATVLAERSGGERGDELQSAYGAVARQFAAASERCASLTSQLSVISARAETLASALAAAERRADRMEEEAKAARTAAAEQSADKKSANEPAEKKHKGGGEEERREGEREEERREATSPGGGELAAQVAALRAENVRLAAERDANLLSYRTITEEAIKASALYVSLQASVAWHVKEQAGHAAALREAHEALAAAQDGVRHEREKQASWRRESERATSEAVAGLRRELAAARRERDELRAKLEAASLAANKEQLVGEVRLLLKTQSDKTARLEAELSRATMSKYASQPVAAPSLGEERADKEALAAQLRIERSRATESQLAAAAAEEKLREASVVLAVWKKSAADKRELNEVRESEAVLRTRNAELSASLAARISGENDALAAERRRYEELAATELAAMAKRLAAAEQERDELRVSANGWRESLARKSADSEALLSEMGLMVGAVEELQRQNERLLSELAQRDHAQQALIQQKAAARQMETLLREEKNQLTMKMAALKKLAAAQKTQLTHLSDCSEALEAAVSKLQEENQQTVAALEREKTALKDLQKSFFELRARGDEAAAARGELAKKLESVLEEKRNLEQNCAAISGKNNFLEQTVAAFRAKGADALVQEQLRTLQQAARCSVCNNNYKNTVLTTCFHTFCRDCVNELISNRSRKCPRCGRPFDKVDVKTVYLDYEELD